MGKKMQWLIDAINSNQTEKIFKFRLSDSYLRYGTVCMPTGTGKSGVMIENIVREMQSCLSNSIGRRYVINISCPTLKLGQQLITDLFEVVNGVISKESFRKEICLVLNSSDSASNYHTYGFSVYSGNFSDSLELALNENSIIIVASCHKSMQKFVNVIEAKFKAYNCISLSNYIDESHMLSVKGAFNCNDNPRVDLLKLKEFSFRLYLFSATPDLCMTKMISRNNTEEYIYRMYPIEAIRENLILPPRIRCFRTALPNNVEIYEYVLEESKMFGGNRKILITLKTTDEMRHTADVLEQRGYKVFGACAADGFTGEDDLTDAVKFAEAVDAWDGDCFVLQIKQLTQGTDIRTLTDAVIPVSNDINPKTYRHLLQTMGRVMRAAPGERGMDYAHRTKKAGNIFFIVDDDSSLNKEESLKRFAMRYYSMECTEYGEGFSTSAEMTEEVKSTKRDIAERVMRESSVIKFFVNVMGESVEHEAENIIMKIDSELYGIDAKNIPEYHLLDNRSLIEYSVNEIKKIL